MSYQQIVGWVSGLALAVSLLFARWGWGKTLEDGGAIKKLQAAVVVVWTLAPPIWFWFQFYFLRDKVREAPPNPAWEEFKYGQDVSSKIWLAAISALLILYFWKDIRGKQ